MCRSFVLVILAALFLAAPASAADPRRAQQWNLDLIEADPAHKVSTGTGAVVAVIDSGVQADHPDLAGRIGPGYDVVQRDGTPQDGDGHGTHVSGIIAAVSGNGLGVESVAPGATIMPIRVLGDDGGGSTDDVAAGVDYARTHGADVINLSLGSEVPLIGAIGGDAFDAAVRRAIAAGIVVVAAAGNNGVPVCEQPSASGLLCVGAVDKRRARSFFSSFGSGLGVVAPGAARTPLKPFVQVKRKQRARAILRRGIRLRVRSVQAGRARVRVKSGGHLIARGSRALRAERTATLVARLTKRGRRLARRRAFKARARVRLPSERRDRVPKIRVR